MFKKAVFVFLLFLCFSLNSFASVFLLEPIESTLENDGSIELGQVARGETFEIVVQRKSGLEFVWDNIAVENNSLPLGWKAESERTDKTLVIHISLPVDAEESIQKISFLLSSTETPFLQESFSVFLTVKRNLLSVSMEGLKQDALVNVGSTVRLLLNNQSVASQRVRVSSTLPNYWFESVDLTIEPMQLLDVNLTVFPHSYGKRNFSFKIESEFNSFEKTFDSEFNVFSTLRGKFSSSLFGFPFFSVSLLPHFLINAILASIS